jgi:hypothetical protein
VQVGIPLDSLENIMHNGYADSTDGRKAKLANFTYVLIIYHRWSFQQHFSALTEYLYVHTKLCATWKHSKNSFQVIFTQTKTKKGKK